MSGATPAAATTTLPPAVPQSSTPLTTWKEEWTTESQDLDKLLVDFEKYRKGNTEVKQTEGKLSKGLGKFKKFIRHWKEDLAIARKKGTIKDAEYEQCIASMKEKEKVIRQMEITLPMNTGPLLYLLLGSVNLTLPQMSDRFVYKEEYERFKFWLTLVTISSATLVYFFPYRVLQQLFQIYLAWYYGSLTVREHILIANGSRMRTWWRVHHYLAICQTCILLMWPESRSFTEFNPQFMLFSAFLGIVQLLQYQYQTSLLYKKRSLGQAELMDATADVPARGSLSILLVVLFFAYLFQLYNAYTLAVISTEPYCHEWQASLSAVIFAVLGLGNCWITTQVVLRKFIRRDNTTKKAE
eukprot:m.82829 g.82829  ORF g.82829 m.82829 type:complete len:355 (+) comp14938_c0_seq1:48-1112(+)